MNTILWYSMRETPRNYIGNTKELANLKLRASLTQDHQLGLQRAHRVVHGSLDGAPVLAVDEQLGDGGEDAHVGLIPD